MVEMGQGSSNFVAQIELVRTQKAWMQLTPGRAAPNGQLTLRRSPSQIPSHLRHRFPGTSA